VGAAPEGCVNDWSTARVGKVDHSDLRRLLASGFGVVLATIRTGEYEMLEPTGNVKPPGWDVAAWFGAPLWLATWSESELARLGASEIGNQVMQQARNQGLSGYLGGAALVEERLAIGQTSNPMGFALVLAAVDWRQVGMVQPIPAPTLLELAPEYQPSSTTRFD
jgi:hypothetical protein